MVLPENAEGNTGPEPPAERLSFTGVVATAWRLYVSNLATLVGIFLIVAFLSSVVRVALFSDLSTAARVTLSYMMLVVLPAFVASFGSGLAAHVFERDLEDDPVTAKTALRETRPRHRDMLSSAALGALFAFFVVLVMGGPGLLIAPLFYGPPVVMQLVALDGYGTRAASDRARRMLKGNWLRLFSYILTIALGISVLSAAALGAGAAVTDPLADVPRVLLLGVLEVIVLGFLLPFLAAASFVFYADLRAEEA